MQKNPAHLLKGLNVSFPGCTRSKQDKIGCDRDLAANILYATNEKHVGRLYHRAASMGPCWCILKSEWRESRQGCFQSHRAEKREESKIRGEPLFGQFLHIRCIFRLFHLCQRTLHCNLVVDSKILYLV